jgi:NADPH-dependent FMN reductase
MAKPTLLLVNASLAGRTGNTEMLLERLTLAVGSRANVKTICLADGLRFSMVRRHLAAADAVVFGTGTHWDGWSSVLQRFLEEATEAEGTRLWLGKPAGCVVSEHSVGGKGVLSRLQGVLLTLGCLLPPMSGLLISRAAVLAAAADPLSARDFWCPEDLEVIAHNMIEAANGRHRWKTWPVDRKDFAGRWMSTASGHTERSIQKRSN